MLSCEPCPVIGGIASIEEELVRCSQQLSIPAEVVASPQMVKVRFESIMRLLPITTVLCKYLPHSMSKNKVSTFLRLRAANKSTVMPISCGMVRRIALLQTHRLEQVREAATKMRDSGFVLHLLFCGGRLRIYRCPRE